MRFIIRLANKLGIDLYGKKDKDLEEECLEKIELLPTYHPYPHDPRTVILPDGDGLIIEDSSLTPELILMLVGELFPKLVDSCTYEIRENKPRKIYLIPKESS